MEADSVLWKRSGPDDHADFGQRQGEFVIWDSHGTPASARDASSSMVHRSGVSRWQARTKTPSPVASFLKRNRQLGTQNLSTDRLTCTRNLSESVNFRTLRAYSITIGPFSTHP